MVLYIILRRFCRDKNRPLPIFSEEVALFGSVALITNGLNKGQGINLCYFAAQGTDMHLDFVGCTAAEQIGYLLICDNFSALFHQK